jgi:hypothetical protein
MSRLGSVGRFSAVPHWPVSDNVVERRETIAGDRAGPVGLAVAAHPDRNQDSPGNRNRVPECGRHRGPSSPRVGPAFCRARSLSTAKCLAALGDDEEDAKYHIGIRTE